MLNADDYVTTITYTMCVSHESGVYKYRYIGDAIELGYTIKTTGADDSIVHIVQ